MASAASVPSRLRRAQHKSLTDETVRGILDVDKTEDIAKAFDAKFGLSWSETAAYAFTGAAGANVSSWFYAKNSELGAIADFYDAFDALFAKRIATKVDLGDWHERLSEYWRAGDVPDYVRIATYLMLSWIPEGEGQRYYYAEAKGDILLDLQRHSAPKKPGEPANMETQPLIQERTYSHDYLLMGENCSSIASVIEGLRIKAPGSKVGTSAEEDAFSVSSGIPLDEVALSELARIVVAADFANNVLCPAVDAALFAAELSEDIASIDNPAPSAPMEIDEPIKKEDIFGLSDSEDRPFNWSPPTVAMDIDTKRPRDIFASDDDDSTRAGPADEGAAFMVSSSAEHIGENTEPSNAVPKEQSTFNRKNPHYMKALAFLYMLSVGMSPAELKSNDRNEKLANLGNILSIRVQDYYMAVIHQFLAVDLPISFQNRSFADTALALGKSAIVRSRLYLDKIFAFFSMFHNSVSRIRTETDQRLYPAANLPLGARFEELRKLGKLTVENCIGAIEKDMKLRNGVTNINDENYSGIPKAIGIVLASVALIEYNKNDVLKRDENVARTNSLLEEALKAIPKNATILRKGVEAFKGAKTFISRAEALADIQAESMRLGIQNEQVPVYNPWAITKQETPVFSLPDSTKESIQTTQDVLREIDICSSSAFTDVHRPLLTTNNSFKESSRFLEGTKLTEVIPLAGHTLTKYLPGGDGVFGAHTRMEAAATLALAAIRLREATRHSMEAAAKPQLDRLMQTVLDLDPELHGRILPQINDPVREVYVSQVPDEASPQSDTGSMQILPGKSAALSKSMSGLAFAWKTVEDRVIAYNTANETQLNIPEVNPVWLTGTYGKQTFEAVAPVPELANFVGPGRLQNVHYIDEMRRDYITTMDALLQMGGRDLKSNARLYYAYYAGGLEIVSKCLASPGTYNESVVAAKLVALKNATQASIPPRGVLFEYGDNVITEGVSKALKLVTDKLAKYAHFTSSDPPRILDVEFMTFTHKGKTYGPIVTNAAAPLYPVPLHDSCGEALEANKNAATAKSSLSKGAASAESDAVHNEIAKQSEIVSSADSRPDQVQRALQSILSLLQRLSFDVEPKDAGSFRAAREADALDRASRTGWKAATAGRVMWHAGTLMRSYAATNLVSWWTGKAAVSSFVLPSNLSEVLVPALTYGVGGVAASVVPRNRFLSMSTVAAAAAAGTSAVAYRLTGIIGAKAQLGLMLGDTALFAWSSAIGETFNREANIDLVAMLRDKWHQKLAKQASTFVAPGEKPDSSKQAIVDAARKEAVKIREATTEARRLYDAFRISDAQTKVFVANTTWTPVQVCEHIFGITGANMWENFSRLVTGGVFRSITEMIRELIQLEHVRVEQVDSAYAVDYAVILALIQFGSEVSLTHTQQDLYTWYSLGRSGLVWTGTAIWSAVRAFACVFFWIAARLVLMPAFLAGLIRGAVVSPTPPGVLSPEAAATWAATGTSGVLQYEYGIQLAGWLAENVSIDGANILLGVATEAAKTMRDKGVEIATKSLQTHLSASFVSTITSALFSAGSWATGAVVNWLFDTAEKTIALERIIEALEYIGAPADMPVISMIAPPILTMEQLSGTMPESKRVSKDDLNALRLLMETNTMRSVTRLGQAKYQLEQFGQSTNYGLYQAFIELWSGKDMSFQQFRELPSDIKKIIKKMITAKSIKTSTPWEDPFSLRDPEHLMDPATLPTQTNLLPIKTAYHTALHIVANVEELRDGMQQKSNLATMLVALARTDLLTLPNVPVVPGDHQTPCVSIQSILSPLIEFDEPVDADNLERVLEQWREVQGATVVASNATPLWLKEKEGEFSAFALETLYVPLNAPENASRVSTQDLINATTLLWILPNAFVFQLPETTEAVMSLRINMRTAMPYEDVEDIFYVLRAVAFMDNACMIKKGDTWLYIDEADNSRVYHDYFQLRQLNRTRITCAVYVGQGDDSNTAPTDRLRSLMEGFQYKPSRPVTRSQIPVVAEADIRTAGIYNMGNSCFYASALQVLSRLKPLRSAFSSRFVPTPVAPSRFEALTTMFGDAYLEPRMQYNKEESEHLQSIFSLVTQPSGSTKQEQIATIGSALQAIRKEMVNKRYGPFVITESAQPMGDAGEFLTQLYTYATGHRRAMPFSTSSDSVMRDLDEYYRRPDVAAIAQEPLYADVTLWKESFRRCLRGHITCTVLPQDLICNVYVPVTSTGKVMVSGLWNRSRYLLADMAECSTCGMESPFFVTERVASVPKVVCLNIQDADHIVGKTVYAHNTKRERGEPMAYTVVANESIDFSSGTLEGEHSLEAIIFYISNSGEKHYTCAIKSEAGAWTLYNDSVVTSYVSLDKLYESKLEFGWTPKYVFYVGKGARIPLTEDMFDAFPYPPLPRLTEIEQEAGARLVRAKPTQSIQMALPAYNEGNARVVEILRDRQGDAYNEGNARVVEILRDRQGDKDASHDYEKSLLQSGSPNVGMLMALYRAYFKSMVGPTGTLESLAAARAASMVREANYAALVYGDGPIPGERVFRRRQERVVAPDPAAGIRPAPVPAKRGAVTKRVVVAAEGRVAKARAVQKAAIDALTAAQKELDNIPKTKKNADARVAAETKLTAATAAMRDADWKVEQALFDLRNAQRQAAEKRPAEDDREEAVPADSDDSVVQTGPKRRRLKEVAEETFMALQALSRK